MISDKRPETLKDYQYIVGEAYMVAMREWLSLPRDEQTSETRGKLFQPVLDYIKEHTLRWPLKAVDKLGNVITDVDVMEELKAL